MEFLLLPLPNIRRVLPWFSLGVFGLFPLLAEEQVDPELEAIRSRAYAAAEFIEKTISNLEDEAFSSEPAKQKHLFGRFPVSPQATHYQCLVKNLRNAFAQLELSCRYPGAEISGTEVLDILLTGTRADFFGSEGHIRTDVYLDRAKMLDPLVLDDDLRLADRLFSLLRETGDSDAKTLENWLNQARLLASEDYLNTKQPLSLSQQAKSVRLLYLLGIVSTSQHVKTAAVEAPGSFRDFRQFVAGPLANTVKEFARTRFENDGPLRDRNLPILTAAQAFIPGLSYTNAGVTTQKDYEKLALAHARGLAEVVKAIDAPMADTQEARRAIGQIIDYRIQPYYIGSLGIREKGALPSPPDGELEVILEHAKFFGENGHLDGDIYEDRVEVLENLFLKPSSEETRDYLFALKTPLEWLSHFRETLIGIEGVNEEQSCLQAIKGGEISALNLKNLFLCRCILSHSAFDSTPELSRAANQIKEDLAEQAPILAVEHFKNNPTEWNKVDLAFVEISHLVPDFDLKALSIPTYDEYLNQRKNYEWAMRTLPRDVIALADPDTPNLLDNEMELFQSDYVYRTGKFNKRLNPVLIKQLNTKLEIIREYRNSQFTPPDTVKRPGMEKSGTAIRELAVNNRFFPNLEANNSQLHDLLEGPKGGLGGLGQFFASDARGYESREAAMDAIASCDELQLADTLFHLAMDAGVGEPTSLDKAAAARKWLNYFRRTQSVARFHSTSKELTNAIRGAFLCRVIVQCDDFINAVEHSPRVAVGSNEDVSSVLENTISSQIRIMNSVLSSVDPSSAMNKDIDHIKERWYIVKAWHTESMKWLESVVADPMLMAEVSRIRSLTREKTKSYADIAPAIATIEETLSAVEPRIIAERHSDRHEELFKPIDFANLVMGQLVTFEQTPTSDNLLADDEEGGELIKDNSEEKLKHLARDITDQLFEDVRSAVAEAGFEDLSKVTSLTQFPAVTRAYYENGSFTKRSEDIAAHELLLHQMKGSVAKAKGRIEAERVTDLKTLEDLAIRASRADRIYFAGDPDRYSLLIDPSFLLHEWNNRHKIETIAEFRTVETRAQAQTQIFRYRKQREQLELERADLAKNREDLDKRLNQAKKWASDNDLEFNPESVIDEMLAMEDQISALKNQITNHEKMEEKYRQHHLLLAQQLHDYKLGEKRFNREKQREILLAKADLPPDLDPEPDIPVIINKPKPKPSVTVKKKSTPKPKPSRSSSYSSSSRSSSASSSSSSRRSSGGGFFQRLFGRRR